MVEYFSGERFSYSYEFPFTLYPRNPFEPCIILFNEGGHAIPV